MLYRTLHWVNQWYALTVLWVYVLLFLLAFSLIFVFPPGVLLLVFVGLGGLGLAVLISKLLQAVEHMVARHMMRRGLCPHCRGHDERFARGEHVDSCAHCGQALDA